MATLGECHLTLFEYLNSVAIKIGRYLTTPHIPLTNTTGTLLCPNRTIAHHIPLITANRSNMKSSGLLLFVLMVLFSALLMSTARAQQEHSKLKKEAKFCQNCVARPLGYLTGKRASMVAAARLEPLLEESIKVQKVPLERVIRWYRSMVANRDGGDVAAATVDEDAMADSREYAVRLM